MVSREDVLAHHARLLSAGLTEAAERFACAWGLAATPAPAPVVVRPQRPALNFSTPKSAPLRRTSRKVPPRPARDRFTLLELEED